MYPNDLQNLTSACPRCGTQNDGTQLICGLCSEVLRKDPGSPPGPSLFAGTNTGAIHPQQPAPV
ncbi:MAG: hypothetical protein P1V35_03850, partial [Planctomycetota bacterium]|nr:hypothetical protein [Planctomycetota bacterium]